MSGGSCIQGYRHKSIRPGALAGTHFEIGLSEMVIQKNSFLRTNIFSDSLPHPEEPHSPRMDHRCVTPA